tara:strand:+ start:1188 stop:1370 length:183 start_codon:yes stop_codon:yes gene_type:complete
MPANSAMVLGFRVPPEIRALDDELRRRDGGKRKSKRNRPGKKQRKRTIKKRTNKKRTNKK